MKKREKFFVSLLFFTLFAWPFTSANAIDDVLLASINRGAKQFDSIQKHFGADIARVFKTVPGMPAFDPDSDVKLKILYSRDDNPCNEIFLEENPEMAEDCKKPRETITFINRYGKKVRVDIKGGEIVSTGLRVPLDPKNPLFCRDVILLHNALIVHDCVLKKYSDNHAKIYHFPGIIPFVEFDRGQNVIFRFGNVDYIKFFAEDFRKTECQGFKLSCQPTFYRNGTRAIPDINYEGNNLHMVTTNWSYPPLSGDFIVYNCKKQIGKVPVSLLYQRLKNDRACPRFKEEGLLCYLQNHCSLELPDRSK